MLNAKKSHKENTNVDHSVQNPHFEFGSVLINLCKLTCIWVGESLIQEEPSREKSTEEGYKGPSDWRHGASSIQLLLCSDLTLRKVKAIVVEAVREVVDIIADYRMLAVHNCAH